MAVLLRKLTRKSTLNFGQYAQLTVQQVLDLKHTRILRWYYYNSSNITFTDDILDELHITEERRIEKPGKNPEFGQTLDNLMERIDKCRAAVVAEKSGKTAEEGIMGRANKIRAHERKKSWNKFIQHRNFDSRWNTKGCLQAINHGHITRTN